MTEANPKVNEAALWLATTWRHYQRPIVTEVRERFGLSINEACQALKLSEKLKRGDHEAD